MTLPGNGIFVVQGEMAMLVTAMRRSTRWGSHSFLNEEFDVLMRTFQELKTILNQVDDLRLIDPLTYLSPFLEVIRSKETTGPVTSIALSAINKFLSYGLIDPTHPSVPATVEDIADAVTHARFVGTDHSSDGVVLMKILQVLRTLMLSPEGAMLTDESVCEIMLSCFRICFETRLTELLRRHAEQCLRDMTQLVFMRLPQFPPEDGTVVPPAAPLSLKKRDRSAKKKSTGAISGTGSLERSTSLVEKSGAAQSDTEEAKKNELLKRHSQDKNLINEAEITIELEQPSRPLHKKHGRHSSMELSDANVNQLLKCVSTDPKESEIVAENSEQNTSNESVSSDVTPSVNETTAETENVKITDSTETDRLIDEVKTDANNADEELKVEDDAADKLEEYVNHRGIRFTPQNEAVNLQPYGLVCVRELFRFLISLSNPLDGQNTSAMVQLGLSLAGTALEVAADHLHNYPSLMGLLKDQMCWNLISLLSTERISIFALDLQVSYLLFESLRHHLKYQMEAFFKKIIEIISADTTKAIYELKEIHHLALEYLSQMFRIPGLCTELYLNYDCDVYCMNVFEELTKLLSQNVVSSTAYNVHTLSLEALMTIIEAIEGVNTPPKFELQKTEPAPQDQDPECKYGRGGHVTLELGGLESSSVASEPAHISQYVGFRHTKGQEPNDEKLFAAKKMKQWITKGVELFNSHPERGIEYLQRHGVLSSPQDANEVAAFLRQCPHLDNKMIGEYICKRSSRGEDECGSSGPTLSVLSAFANSFEFAGLRIDRALRLYLEAFRLPGEAPLIFLLMEKFSERWHTENGSPFANTDAAFRLAYAIIMLNMDQHNHNAKKLNVPMTVEDFVKNLRGCNGSGDFDQQLLEGIFHSIKNEEMIMPAERAGAVRDAWLWRVLQRRGDSPSALYLASHQTSYAALLFRVAGLPTVTALSAAFERAPNPTAEELDSPRDCPAIFALKGLERCAALTTLSNNLGNEETEANDRLTIDTLLLTLCKFTGLSAHNNYIAIGVTLGQSSKAQRALVSACSTLARHGDAARAAWAHLLLTVHTLFVGRLLPQCMIEVEDYLAPNNTVSLIREVSRGADAGLLSSLYSYIALGETGLRAPTPHEKTLIEAARSCVAKCNLPALLVEDTKFLPMESLHELVRAMIAVGAPPDSESLQMNPELEDITIFFLELLGKTLIQNRDRVLTVWEDASAHICSVLVWSSTVSTGGAAGASSAFGRCATALLRTAARLMRSEHCAAAALRTLAALRDLPYRLLHAHADIITSGIYDIVKTSAQNVHTAAEWRLLLSLSCTAGAGAVPHVAHAKGASSRSEGSSDESERRALSAGSDSERAHSPRSQGWIMVKSETGNTTDSLSTEVEDLYTGERVSFRATRSSALARCAETMSLVVRDMSHVAPHNCRCVVRALRIAARPTLHTGKKAGGRSGRHKSRARRGDDSSDEDDNTLDQYHMISIQLLDLMHTLLSRTAQIFKWWREEADHGQGEEYDLWELAWMPLLQGIALYCTDRRKQVANSALAYLQRALLAPSLAGAGAGGGSGAGAGAGGAAGWARVVRAVLLPLLSAAPPPHRPRAHTLLCKVFLHHLSALSGLPTFPELWTRVLAASGSFITGDNEPLAEAALESLKNMLLVMHSVKIFNNGDGYTDLWYLTWEKIAEFQPNLKNELFPDEKDTKPTNLPSHMQPPIPSTFPTIVPVSPLPGNVPQIVPAQPQVVPTPPQLVPTQPQMVPTQPQMVPTQPQIVPTQPQSVGNQYQNVSYNQQESGNIQDVNTANLVYNTPENQQDLTKLPPANMSQYYAQSVPSMPIQIAQNPYNVPQMQLAQSPPSLGQSPPNLPVSMAQFQSNIISPVSPNMGNVQSMGQSRDMFASPPTLVSQSPPNLIAPTPVSGMVPIRNALYSQSGLTSSILLQPLNEMVSTPIGVSPPQMPILYPTKGAPSAIVSSQNELHSQTTESILPATIDVQEHLVAPERAVEQTEIFSDYLNNPYNEAKEFSTKEATIYEPKTEPTDQAVPLRNPQLSKLEQKSLSENSSPMHHANKGQFSSTDNLRSEGSSIFNFASYFGSGDSFANPNSEVFDNLLSTHEG